MLLSSLTLALPQRIALYTLAGGLVLLAAWWSAPSWLAPRVRGWSPRNLIRLMGGIALVVRLIPNALLPVGAGYDVASYELVADAVLEGQDVYSDPEAMNRHPYLPLQMYWMAAAKWLSGQVGVSFVRAVRTAPILADVGITVLVFCYLQKRATPQDSVALGLGYALNPVSIFVSACHGQFDAIPLLFLVAAILAHTRRPQLSAASLGLGILSKSWPVLALPSLLWRLDRWSKRATYLLIVGLVPALGVLLYATIFRAPLLGVISKAIGYDWGVGVWGYTYLLRLVGLLAPALNGLFAFAQRYGRFLTLAALGVVWLFRARRESVAQSVLTVFVTFFACSHAFSIQYLVWLIPMAALCRQTLWLRRYTLAATAYMILVYSTLILASHITNLLPWPQADWFIIMPSGLPAWVVTVAWAVARWRRSLGERAIGGRIS